MHVQFTDCGQGESIMTMNDTKLRTGEGKDQVIKFMMDQGRDFFAEKWILCHRLNFIDTLLSY